VRCRGRCRGRSIRGRAIGCRGRAISGRSSGRHGGRDGYVGRLEGEARALRQRLGVEVVSELCISIVTCVYVKITSTGLVQQRRLAK